VTTRDLIKGSLRLIGSIASGETSTAAEEADALSSLNDLLENWSIEGLLVYQNISETFPLVGGQAAYTMGLTGNFNTTRPIKIINASILYGQTEVPLKILTHQQWAEIETKSNQSNVPQVLYQSGSYPLDTINFWPVPTGSSSLVLYSLKPLAAFTSVNDVLNLPPGYARALRYNLAIELAPEYGRDPSAMVAMAAQESKADLKRQNIQPVFMVSDAVGLIQNKLFNINTGE
jgi:hypothetical protein